MDSKEELIHAKNILISFKRAEFKGMIGAEVIALAKAIEWLQNNVKELESEIKDDQDVGHC